MPVVFSSDVNKVRAVKAKCPRPSPNTFKANYPRPRPKTNPES